LDHNAVSALTVVQEFFEHALPLYPILIDLFSGQSIFEERAEVEHFQMCAGGEMKRSRIALRFGILSVSLLSICVSLCNRGFAGEARASSKISGRLVSMEGRAISGCKTVLKMTASQIGEKVEDFSPIEIRTSDDGGFLFGNLQPGFYGIEFSQGGAPGGVFHYRPKYSGTISRKIVIQDKSVDLGDIPLYKAGLRIKGRVYVNGALRAGAEVFSRTSAGDSGQGT
jgi:hypothetical protein